MKNPGEPHEISLLTTSKMACFVENSSVTILQMDHDI